ncbi:MAG: FadR family transcriptional regulator [Casimicrobiaceae bacterium]|nr:FadR family transcriptional regulator [Casimicrobiaceae bacterium]
MDSPNRPEPSTAHGVSPRVRLRRGRTLALELVDLLCERIRDNTYAPGSRLPSEAALAQEFGVSRTVVRETISKLQAAGLVETRHGIGTFVIGLGEAPTAMAALVPPQTIEEVLAVLELRLAVETEAAALAAKRRTAADLEQMAAALAEFHRALETDADTVRHDLAFHEAIARATQNTHFLDALKTLGPGAIPRARLDGGTQPTGARYRAYLRSIHAEHENIYEAIRSGDASAARAAMRTHLANSRERRRRAAYPTEST